MTKQSIKFIKMCGAGNDFLVIDNRNRLLRENRLKNFARMLCDRKRGVGADGFLLLENSKKADFRMRIFNPDGSEPDMCGNGARCIAFYASKNHVAKNKMTFETKAGLISAGVKGKTVKLRLREPSDLRLNLDVRVGRRVFKVSTINTGVPHAVLFVNDLEKVNVKDLGSKIRWHRRFSPAGANVNFVKKEGMNTISIRTYERGVEDETLACGTGSTASALISSLVKGITPPVHVQTRGGEVLKIYFAGNGEKFSDVYLEGEVKEVFGGKIW